MAKLLVNYEHIATCVNFLLNWESYGCVEEIAENTKNKKKLKGSLNECNISALEG